MKKILKGIVITIVGWLGLSTLADGIFLRYHLVKRLNNVGYFQACDELGNMLKEWSQQ